MRIFSTSREYVIVPAGLLAASPAAGTWADLAFVADDGTEPAAPDWLPALWLNDAAGGLLGAGRLVGSGAGGTPLPRGEYMLFVREHLSGGQLPVWEWTRLTVGL